MNNTSGVGVLDKAVCVLAAVESGPATLAQLVKATGLARPTTHRIAVALEHHRLLARDVQGRFVLGPRVAELASAAGEDRLLAVAQPVLIQLRDQTGESAQLYRRQADVRICVAAAEREAGVASVSAPVRGAGGKVLAAVSVSGPIERLTRSPGRLHAAAVVAAGEKISDLLRTEPGQRP